MRTSALLACAGIASVFQVAAQSPFEHADQRTAQTAYGKCTRFPGGWAVEGNAVPENQGSGTAYIHAFGLDGTSLWEHPLLTNLGAGVFVQGLATAANGDLLACASLFYCDVPADQFLAERIAPDGSTVWSRTFHASDGIVSAMALSPGGTIAFSTNSGLLIADAAGDSLGWITLPGALHFSSLAWDSDTTLLGTTGNSSVTRVSTDGALLATATVNGTIAAVLPWQGKRLVLTTGGMLYALQPDLGVQGNVDLGNTPGYRQLLPLATRLIAAGPQQYAFLDTSLSVQPPLPIDPDGEFPQAFFTRFAADDSMLLMTGTANLGWLSTGVVRGMLHTGQHAAHTEDVGIEVLAIDSVYYTLNSGIVFPKADATVRITNQGTVEVQSFRVAYRGPMGVACGYAGTSVQVENAALAPGGHVDMAIAGMPLYYGPWNYVTLRQPLCIVVQSPNNLYDRHMGDNMACDTVQIVLSLADHAAPAQGVMVNNPFQDAMELALPAPLASPMMLSLRDATGRLVATTTWPPGSERLHWALPLVTDGLYLLRMEGPAGGTSRTLVRQGG